MAEKISRGVNSVENIEAIIRTLPNIKNTFDNVEANFILERYSSNKFRFYILKYFFTLRHY